MNYEGSITVGRALLEAADVLWIPRRVIRAFSRRPATDAGSAE